MDMKIKSRLRLDEWSKMLYDIEMAKVTVQE